MLEQQIKEIVIKMADVYKGRHESKQLKNNVWRGTSTNCSSEFEDLMGELIGDFFGKEYVVLVSYPITLRRKQELWTVTKRKNVWRKHDSREPDILVYRKSDCKIIAILDLKNDVSRTSDNWIKDANNLRDLMRNAETITYKPKEGEKGSIEIKYSDDVYYSFVILNAENEHGKLNNYFKEMADSNLPYFILNTETHLNAVDKITEEKINCEENVNQWRELSRELKQLIQLVQQ